MQRATVIWALAAFVLVAGMCLFPPFEIVGETLAGPRLYVLGFKFILASSGGGHISITQLLSQCLFAVSFCGAGWCVTWLRRK